MTEPPVIEMKECPCGNCTITIEIDFANKEYQVTTDLIEEVIEDDLE